MDKDKNSLLTWETFDTVSCLLGPHKVKGWEGGYPGPHLLPTLRREVGTSMSSSLHLSQDQMSWPLDWDLPLCRGQSKCNSFPCSKKRVFGRI